jgi:Leucine-rich repeat (LRR) protein
MRCCSVIAVIFTASIAFAQDAEQEALVKRITERIGSVRRKDDLEVGPIVSVSMGPQSTDEDIASLKIFDQLERISIGSTRISGTGFGSLRNSKKLHTLSVDKHSMTVAGAEAIGSLHQLEKLVLQHSVMRDKIMRPILKLKNLRQLDISGNPFLSDDSLQDLAQLTKLQRLNLSNCGPTEATFLQLSTLEKLEWIDVSRTPIRDDGLLTLASLSSIRSIIAHSTETSSLGLSKAIGRLPKGARITR